MTLTDLEDESRKRKERLLQWKMKKQFGINKRKEYADQDQDKDEKNELDGNVEREEALVAFPKPIFRNYKPHESGPLSGALVLPRPQLVDVKSIIDGQLKDKSQSNSTNLNEMIDNVDLLTLAPRKPDWDLKRDVEKKFKRLEKRTARAIAELTRERLLSKQKSSETSLAEVVATTSKLNEAIQDDED